MKQFLTLLLSLCLFALSQAQQSSSNDPLSSQFGALTNSSHGYLEVPQNRNDPNSEKIRLAYVVLKANHAGAKADPIVYLQGGPGGATLPMTAFFQNNPLRYDRDMIFMDQRGTGLSNAVCTDLGQSLLDVIKKDLGPEEEHGELSKLVDGCKAEIKKKGFDVTGYNSRENALDLEDLRKHLGYGKWNLMGGSYGSRLALTYMRDFPQNVRSSVMSGMFPTQVNLYENFVSNMARSITMTLDACESDANCARKYPNIKSVFFETLADLRSEAYEFSWNGQPFYLNAQDMLLLSHQLLYIRQTIAQLPAFVMSIKNKEPQAVRAALSNVAGRVNLINIAMNWSVNAHEEVGFSGVAHMKADLARNPEFAPGPAFFISDPTILENWHSDRAKAYENEPVVSDIPSFVVNGAFDPITPPANAVETIKTLSNVFYTEFPNDGHSTFNNCYFGMVRQFLDNPSKEPDAGCVNRPVKFNWR